MTAQNGDIKSMEEALELVIDKCESATDKDSIETALFSLFHQKEWYDQEQLPDLLVSFMQAGKVSAHMSGGKMLYSRPTKQP